MHNRASKLSGGGGGKQKLAVKNLMEQHPMLFCALTPGIRDDSSVQKAWLVKRKEQTMYLGIE